MIPRLDCRGGLLDQEGVQCALVITGLSDRWAMSKARLLAACETALRQRGSGRPSDNRSAFFVPGRIEVLGKHTDYVGGTSLLAAAEQGFVIACTPREDRSIHVIDVGRRETAEFLLSGDITPAIGHWSNYPMTVARRMARNFPQAARGADIAFGSDLPPASGMSSSSAMIIAFFLALAEANAIWSAPLFQANVTSLVEFASYLATIENGQNFGPLEGDLGVGTAGGSEDHTAILCCRARTLSQYAYCPARHVVDVPLCPLYLFVIASSGVAAEKTGTAMAAYNRASRLAALAAQAWRESTGRNDVHLAAAIASSSDGAAEVRRVLEAATLVENDVTREELLTRFDHFCRENEQIQPAAIAALQADDMAGDMAAFGQAVDESQDACERLLGNQIPETQFLATEARRLGAIAASAFGAGFGGSVWALTEWSQAGEFAGAWQQAYATAFPQYRESARFFTSEPGPSAMRIL